MKKILFFLLITGTCIAQNARYDNIAYGVVGPNNSMVPITNGVVTILSCTANSSSCVSTASLCASITDAVCGLNNSVGTDLAGNYHFYALPGRYKSTASATGFAPFTITDIILAPSAIDTIKIPAAWNFTGGLTSTSITLTNGPATQTIASGTAAMPTSSVAAVSGTTITCVAAAGNPFTATNVLTTDIITFVPNAAPSSPNTGLIVQAWPTANGVNFEYCNPTASALTPVAETLNWRVMR